MGVPTGHAGSYSWGGRSKQVTLYRFTRGLRLSRLGSTAAVCVVLGQIIAVPIPAPAQSPPEQLPSASEKTKDADLGTGKEPVANTASTSHHVDSTKDKAEATDKDGANPWRPVPTEKASLSNLAPVLLPYFNNGPVFGISGTDGVISGIVPSSVVIGEELAQI